MLKILLLALYCHASIGVTNKNPGNISTQNIAAWDGAVGYDNFHHLKFIDDFHGIKAIKTNLRIYKNKHGIKTVYGLVYRWIPKKDTEAQHWEYINFVCTKMGGCDPFRKFDFENNQTCEKLTKAIIYYECGENPYPQKLYDSIFRR